MGPRRTFATIVFFDIVGSMEMSEDMSPEAWWTIVERMYDDMCDAALRFGGEIGNYTGDGIYALFHDDGSTPGHALRALRAAWWLHEQLEATRICRGGDVSIRTGIHSGEVVVGTLGRRRRCIYAVNGYAVGLAKRLEGIAPVGGIAVSADTAALLPDACELLTRGPVAVKGARRPVQVYELAAMDRPVSGRA